MDYPINRHRLDTAFGVLEVARDDDEHLTDDERAVLNEAHAVLQEWDARRFGFYHGTEDGGTTPI